MPTPIDWQSDKQAAACIQFYHDLDSAIETADVRDVQASRIEGFPFIRINRFLASFKDEAMDSERFATWLGQMQTLASQAYTIELRNLPKKSRATIGTQQSIHETLSACSIVLTRNLLKTPDKKETVRARAVVKDNYQRWKRVLGGYPIIGWAFMAGINDWHKDTKKVFSIPLQDLPVVGQLNRYAPKIKPSIQPMRLSKDALGIPKISDAEKRKLFDQFSPIIDVDIATQDDEIGTMIRQENIVIDTKRPVIYEHLSYTRFHGKVLLQLNYVFWFPSRPKISAIDFLGGHIDGITWRVTLADDGKPLIYDTIHNCGCYHLFFPTKKLLTASKGKSFEEGVLIPQIAPNLSTNERIIIRVEHRTHYIQRLSKTNMQSGNKTYHTINYNSLRSIASPQGYKSAFESNGLMIGTQRLERYFFWPMGITEPGSMRQWGNHPTAFVGQRHFDEAYLLERYFDWEK